MVRPLTYNCDTGVIQQRGIWQLQLGYKSSLTWHLFDSNKAVIEILVTETVSQLKKFHNNDWKIEQLKKITL